jgi:hypothetical protein
MRERTGQAVRIVLAVGLLAVSVVAGMAAYGALANLWADYQDSSKSTYLLVGLPALGLCIAALVSAAIVALRPGSRAQSPRR